MHQAVVADSARMRIEEELAAVRRREARRQRWIERFVERERCIRRWIAWQDIAIWCSREAQPDIRPDETKRALAYAELVIAWRTGEFDEVLLLCFHTRLTRLNREMLEMLPELPPARMADAYWRYCWVPNAAARQWFSQRARPVPGWLLEQPDSSEPGKSAVKHAGGRPAKFNWTGFDAEVVRIANAPDGLPERPTLTRTMMEWCSRTWGTEPAESEVRKRVAALYPRR